MNNSERTGTLVWRLIYPLLVFIGVEFAVEFVSVIFFTVRGLNGGIFENLDADEITKLAMDFIYGNALYFTIVRSIFTVPLYILFMKRDLKYDKRLNRYEEYGEYDRRFLFLIIPVGIGASIGFNGLVTLSGIVEYSKTYQELSKMVYNGNVAVEIIATAVAAPVTEELLFRGLIYKRLRHHIPPVWCMVISAAVFGLIHGNIVQFVYAFLVGIILAYLYERFKTVWAPIIMHCIANLSAVLITEFLPEYEGALTLGTVMLASVIALAATFAALKFIDMKVRRSKI